MKDLKYWKHKAKLRKAEIEGYKTKCETYQSIINKDNDIIVMKDEKIAALTKEKESLAIRIADAENKLGQAKKDYDFLKSEYANFKLEISKNDLENIPKKKK